MPATGELYNPWRLFVGFIIPNAISRCTELSSTGKLVFGKLCQYAGENGKAYPSYKTLGCEVGVKERQAMRAVQELVKFGLIRLVKQNRPDGGSTSNVYEFLWHDIFISGTLTSPGVKHDTGGSVTNFTPTVCQIRHPGVSDMTPKENHTRESKCEETTTEQIRMLLSGTVFSVVSDSELNVMITINGSDKVMLAADIAAEKWRRDRKEIRNPGGYLQTLCKSPVIPDWYDPPHVRAAKSEAATEWKRTEEEKQAELKKAEVQESKERDDYWHSLSKEDRQKHRDEFRATAPFLQDLKDDFLDGLAKLNTWDKRQQMNTNTSSIMKAGR